MAEFEIYFSGLMCFICNGTRLEMVDLVDDAEHTPLVWLGPSAQKHPDPIRLSGEPISFDLQGDGPVCDPNPESPFVHLQPLIDGSPQLRPGRRIAGRMRLPDGKRRIAMQLDDAIITLPNGSTRKQPVAQLAVLICKTDAAQVMVTVGDKSDVLDSSSFMVLGNLSAKHDPKVKNHFPKYKNLTTGGGKIGTITDGTYNGTLFNGKHAAEAKDFVLAHVPQSSLLTLGAPDCTITQWP